MASPNDQREPRDNLPLLLGIVTIVSGVATGLFSDLRTPSKVVLWVIVIGRVLCPAAAITTRPNLRFGC